MITPAVDGCKRLLDRIVARPRVPRLVMRDEDHDLVPQKHAPAVQFLSVNLTDEVFVLENATV
jgi:hypothetical protein